jgi:hypothetical protein
MKKIKIPSHTLIIKDDAGNELSGNFFYQVANIVLNVPVDQRTDFTLVNKIVNYLSAHPNQTELEMDDAWIEYLLKCVDKYVKTKNEVELGTIALAQYFVIPLEEAE